MAEPTGTKLAAFKNKQGGSSEICFGLSLYWLKFVKEHGVTDSIRRLSDEEAHFAYMVQGNYESLSWKDGNEEVKTAKLLGFGRKLFIRSRNAFSKFEFEFIWGRVQGAYALCLICTDDHAMAMLYGPNQNVFFDQNERFYSCGSPQDMLADLGKYLASEYLSKSKYIEITIMKSI